jgi:hypothetical protein
VTTLRGESVAKEQIFTSTPAGSEVSALDVISSASDEPDYGLDIGLWEDSGTAYGVHYAFGSQPFGNPKLENTSQAPFHMGFFHESRLLYTAAPYIRHTYCLYRIHLYAALSRHAFATGHPYWGWRFAGWSLHYVQDLTQPYHAKALPGVGMSRIVWASALDALGFHGPKQDAIQLISNRHFALENYAYHRVHAAYQEARSGDPLLVALSDPVADSPYAPWHDSSPEDEVSLEASNVADDLDALLSESVPSHLVSDPAYVFSEADPHVPDVFEVVGLEPPEVQDRLTNALAGLMQRVGIHSRRLVQFILT